VLRALGRDVGWAIASQVLREFAKQIPAVFETISGYDQRDLLARRGPNKRREFFYWTDDGNLAGRYSWNSRLTVSMCGLSRWCNFACRCCSTFDRPI
jgi:hypothetical protein